MSTMRILITAVAMALICGVALADGRPEFDRVGNDAFVPSSFSSAITKLVIQKNGWNYSSDFPDESFNTPAALNPDPCFSGAYSALTVPGTPRTYTWYIVLQMDPESDLAINLTDCALRPGAPSPFGGAWWFFDLGPGAGQTGRYVLPDGTPVFNPGANPQVTAVAMPGPNAAAGFVTPFDLVTRTQGGLYLLPFRDVLYTSSGMFEESLVARMPEFLVPNLSGETEYPLSAGDIIKIDVYIPPTNPVDVRYGQYNVYVKYIGTAGTQLTFP